MRRLWISIAILGTMIVLLTFHSIHLNRLIEPLTADISQASEAAREEKWSQAEKLSEQAKMQWQTHAPYLRFVQCHTDIDEIVVLLNEADSYLSCKDAGGYTATNARAIGAMESLRGLERVSLDNLF